METRTDILNELTALSPLVAAINKANVYTVPQGYFETIGETVLACLHVESDINELPAKSDSSEVPAGYFDMLANSILGKIKALETVADETSTLSPLLSSIQNRNVFDVPSGYFESLDESIINIIKTPQSTETLDELSPLMRRLQTSNVFELPAGYFQNLDTVITDKIKFGAGESTTELSPLMQDLQNKNVFEVPDGYFTTVAGNVLNKLKPASAKIVSMPKRSIIMKYAAAAMLTGAIALGVYKYSDQPATDAVTPKNYTAAKLDPSIEKGKSMDEKQFNEAMESLTDADIASYLEKNGDITDIASINKNLEPVNLPAEDDYLLDEKTLENYLKEIDETTLNN